MHGEVQEASVRGEEPVFGNQPDMGSNTGLAYPGWETLVGDVCSRMSSH